MSMAKFRKVKNNRKNSPTRGMIYGRAVVNRVVHTSAIAKNITERCTVTEPDILAVINALMTEISANIAEGNKVVLDNFGSFKLGIRTSPAVSAKKFTSANIKAMYIIYSPYSVMDQGKRVKPMLSGIKMEEMTEYNGIEDKENGGGTSGAALQAAELQAAAPERTTPVIPPAAPTRTTQAAATPHQETLERITPETVKAAVATM